MVHGRKASRGGAGQGLWAVVLAVALAGPAAAQTPPWDRWHPPLEPPWPRVSRALLAPDGRARIMVRYDLVPSDQVPLGGRIVSTLLLAVGEGPPRPVHRGRMGPSGEPVGFDGAPRADANLSQLLVLSWSSDSARVLLEERVGARQSDVFEARPLVYDVGSGQVRVVPLASLAAVVHRHWGHRGEDLRHRDLQLNVLGWDRRSPSRLLVQPVLLWEHDAPFLGVWSVALDGRSPRLVAERPRSVQPGLFGTPETP
jgi:hypothetical protein